MASVRWSAEGLEDSIEVDRVVREVFKNVAENRWQIFDDPSELSDLVKQRMGPI